jgi:hypothetical protein
MIRRTDKIRVGSLGIKGEVDIIALDVSNQTKRPHGIYVPCGLYIPVPPRGCFIYG